MEDMGFIFDIEVAGLSDVGRVRSLNEDSFGIERDLGLVVLADGMGGHGNGDIASRLAVESIVDFVYECAPSGFGDGSAPAADDGDDTTLDATLDGTETDGDVDTLVDDDTPVRTQPTAVSSGGFHPVAVIRGAIRRANQRILSGNQERRHPAGQGMGTTVVGMWLPPGFRQVVVFHAGDSRLYRMRKGQLTQLTRDHSMYQSWLDAGAQGPAPARNIILRALGMGDSLIPDISLHDVMAGDVYLACSDGLTGMVKDPDIVGILSSGAPLAEQCATLIERANANGGRDNTTVVLTALRDR